MKSISAPQSGLLSVFFAMLALTLALSSLVPLHASAAAVSVTSITATSSNVYTNTGFATTSRVTTGDQVRYQLTLGGTPLITPQINIFNMGSTTMSGSAGAWFYSTTSVTVWTEGPVTFYMSVGGTAGDATTTVSQSSVTTNVTYDATAPTLSSISWSDVDSSTQFSATDTFTLTFSETMATSTITAGNVDTTLALSGSHTFGTSPTVSWNTAGTVLTLTLGTSPSVATADTVNPSGAVRDSVGIADATSAALTITDNVAPNAPGGLDYINFGDSLSFALTSTGSSQIRYTTDGTTPTCSVGTVYSSAVTVTQTTTVNAVGCDEASNISSVSTGIFTLSSGGGGNGGGSSSKKAAIPATPATQIEGCTPGAAFNTMTGKSCTVSAIPATPSANAAWNRDLTVGAQGEDVRGLQVFLNTHGYTIASSGPGSKGSETAFFGGLTRAALVKYQQAKGITPAVGYFGPKTRAAVNAGQ